MKALFKKRQKKVNKVINIEEILLNNPEHKWIVANKTYLRFFTQLLSELPKNDFFKLNSDKELCFLYSPARYASAIAKTDKYHFIIIYPELLEMISCVNNGEAYAIMLHELAHLVLNHSSNDLISPLQKEIEADIYAAKLGHYNEILEILNKEPDSYEIRKRKELLILQKSSFQIM